MIRWFGRDLSDFGKLDIMETVLSQLPLFYLRKVLSAVPTWTEQRSSRSRYEERNKKYYNRCLTLLCGRKENR
jgi:hypothetical protein